MIPPQPGYADGDHQTARRTEGASTPPRPADVLEQQAGEALLASSLAVREGTGPSAQRAASALNAVLVELRATTATMRGELPPVAGLADAVTRYAARYGLAVRSEIDLDERSLDHGDSTALVGVVREAFANAARHAHARTVQLTAARGRSGIRMVIEDDGGGMTAADLERARTRGNLGIAGMEGLALWRRGTVTLSASASGGLRIEVALPGTG